MKTYEFKDNSVTIFMILYILILSNLYMIISNKWFLMVFEYYNIRILIDNCYIIINSETEKKWKTKKRKNFN